MGVLLYLAQDALRLKNFSLTELELGLVQVVASAIWQMHLQTGFTALRSRSGVKR